MDTCTSSCSLMTVYRAVMKTGVQMSVVDRCFTTCALNIHEIARVHGDSKSKY